MGGRSGQAFLSFVVTYGWIVVLLALVALYLYREGVILVRTDLNASCMGFEALTYVRHGIARDGSFSITFKNQGVEPVTLRRVTVEHGERSWSWEGSRSLAVGDSREVGFGGVVLGIRRGDPYRVRVRAGFERGGIADLIDEAWCVGPILGEDAVTPS